MAQVTCDEGPDAIDIQFAEAGVVVLARVESTKLVSKMDPATGIRLPTELSRIKVTKTFKGKSRGWRDIFVFADTSEHPSLWLGTTYLFFLSDIGELKNCNNIVFNLQRDRAKLTKLNHLAHSR
jgi:hypothetical protein